MPKDKTEMHQKIIIAAREEFLEKGYEETTMRSIATKAGITVSGIYKHFSSKEDMFHVLVAPVVQQMNEILGQYEKIDYAYMDNDDIEGMWIDGPGMKEVVTYIYENYTVFKLLVCCSKGSEFADYVSSMAKHEEKTTLEFMKELQKRGKQINFIPEKEMHLLVVQMINAIFDVVVYDFSKEEALHYIDTISEVYLTGIRKVLKF